MFGKKLQNPILIETFFKRGLMVLKFCTLFGLLLGIFLGQPAMAAPIQIVAAENFYGSVAKEIGGSFVQVKSILNQPDQDPHLFSVSPSIAKNLGQADLIVFNGLGYDSWMQGLLSISRVSTQTVICVGQLINKKEGDNPHIWYDPATMPVYAKALYDYLSKKDPHHQISYKVNYRRFIEHYSQLTHLIKQLKLRTQHRRVIATEPVFAYMAAALGLEMQAQSFQISMMNGVDPSPRQVQEFQKALQTQAVSILFYNKQVSNPLVQQLLQSAKVHAIPIVGITEVQPDNKPYIQWMLDPLKQVEGILNERHKL
jgi:zinc/manganese transport system substrate-binding protein